MLADTINEMGLSLTSMFVPFSVSRYKDEKYPSLNWIVTLHYKGKPILTTDFMSGMGHCPTYKQNKGKLTYDVNQAIKMECERGFESRFLPSCSYLTVRKDKPILPDICSVVHCLIADADAINYRDFDDWASSFGYDSDSRKAELTYKQCLDIGLKLRNGLGEANLAKLVKACSNY